MIIAYTVIVKVNSLLRLFGIKAICSLYYELCYYDHYNVRVIYVTYVEQRLLPNTARKYELNNSNICLYFFLSF